MNQHIVIGLSMPLDVYRTYLKAGCQFWEISSSDSGVAEDSNLLGCDAVLSGVFPVI
jgi:hypothetical protein